MNSSGVRTLDPHHSWGRFPAGITTTFETSSDRSSKSDYVPWNQNRAVRIVLVRGSASTLVYCGGDDDPDDYVTTAQALKTELHVVEGCDHFGAFKEMDRVMPLAVAFLKTAASTYRLAALFLPEIPLRGTIQDHPTG